MTNPFMTLQQAAMVCPKETFGRPAVPAQVNGQRQALIIAEGDEVSEAFAGGDALDAGLITAAQAVEHYEITRYGTMIAWARQLGLSEIEGRLAETLAEEESTDELLSKLAEDAINPAAA